MALCRAIYQHIKVFCCIPWSGKIKKISRTLQIYILLLKEASETQNLRLILLRNGCRADGNKQGTLKPCFMHGMKTYHIITNTSCPHFPSTFVFLAFRDRLCRLAYTLSMAAWCLQRCLRYYFPAGPFPPWPLLSYEVIAGYEFRSKVDRSWSTCVRNFG